MAPEAAVGAISVKRSANDPFRSLAVLVPTVRRQGIPAYLLLKRQDAAAARAGNVVDHEDTVFRCAKLPRALTPGARTITSATARGVFAGDQRQRGPAARIGRSSDPAQ